MCPLFHCLLLNNTEIQRISKTCPKWEVMLLIVVQVAKHVIFENLQMIYVFKQQMKACKCINGYKNTSILSTTSRFIPVSWFMHLNCKKAIKVQ